MPYCWQWSLDLPNDIHLDPDIYSSFTVWLHGSDGSAGAYSQFESQESGWFLFPLHGVAVHLTHQVAVTWPGNHAPHCSSVPETHLPCYSLFTSLSYAIEAVWLFQSACWLEYLYYHRSQIVHPLPSQQVVFLVQLSGSTGQDPLHMGYSWWRRGPIHSAVIIGPGADGDVSVRYYWSGGAR
jgi:hypothetical protein